MSVNKEVLNFSIEYFDELSNELISNPPEDFNPKHFMRHYNDIKNALAYYMAQDADD